MDLDPLDPDFPWHTNLLVWACPDVFISIPHGPHDYMAKVKHAAKKGPVHCKGLVP